MAAMRRSVVVLGLLGIGAAAAWAAWPLRPEPAPTRTLLVTGFGPFGGYETNPAWESVKDLDGTTVGGLRVRTARIDVVYAKAGDQLQAALDRVRPDLVLCLGVAPDPWIRVETTARNRDACPSPDVAGETRTDAAIRPGGAETVATRLPVARILEALRAGGYEVRTSDDAGGYLCNHLFYELLARVPPEKVGGFVHVPPLAPPWDLERLRAAVRRVIEAIGEAPAPAASDAPATRARAR
jgi:pyroglutamyl-peptidase